jgi:hypothetical protein
MVVGLYGQIIGTLRGGLREHRQWMFREKTHPPLYIFSMHGENMGAGIYYGRSWKRGVVVVVMCDTIRVGVCGWGH